MSWARRLLPSLIRSQETGWVFAVTGTLAYVAYLIALHAHHEFWRDEIHFWSIARMADGFWDLVTGDRVYDGHPPLWYWYLRLWTFITRRPWGLHAATILAMGSAALLFLRYAPLPRLLKLLLLASYLLGYEYGVVSRNYTTTWLLLAAFCAAYHPLRPRFILLTVLLSLLALTTVFGMFIACVLFLMLIPIGASYERPAGEPSAFVLRVDPRLLLAGATLACVLVFFVWSTKPPDPNANSPDWQFEALNLDNAKVAVHRIVFAFLPVRGFEHPAVWMDFGHFWSEHQAVLVPLGLALVALFLLALWPGRLEMAGLLVGITLIAVFGIVRWGIEMRQQGNMVLLALALVWIHRLRFPRRNHLLSTIALAVVGCFHLQGFVAATWADWKHPFSGGQEIAAFVEKAGLQDLSIVAGPDPLVLTVPGYLDRPFISSQTEEIAETQVFHSRHRIFSADDLMARAAKEVKAHRQPVLVVCTCELPAAGAGMKLTLLKEGRSDIAPNETFWLYRMDEP